MAREPFRVEGVEELRKTLGELNRPAQKNALKRTLQIALDPLAKAVKSRSPKKWGDLEESLHVGTKLTRRQSSMNRDGMRGQYAVELHFGTADPAGMMEEFGLGNSPLTPFFRPEWEGRKNGIRDTIGRELGNQIVRAGERAARRRAKGTAAK